MTRRSDKQGIFFSLAAVAFVLSAASSGCADASARSAPSAWSKSLMSPSGFVRVGQSNLSKASAKVAKSKGGAEVIHKVSKAVTDVVSTMVVLDPLRRHESSSYKRRASRRGLQRFDLPMRDMTEVEVDRSSLNHDGSTRVDLRYRSTRSLSDLSSYYQDYLEGEGFAMREISVSINEHSPVQLLGERGGDLVSAVFTRDRGQAVSVANLRVKLQKKARRRR